MSTKHIKFLESETYATYSYSQPTTDNSFHFYAYVIHKVFFNLNIKKGYNQKPHSDC